MARKPEDIKKELARRSLARKKSKVEVAEVEELETEMLTDMEEDFEEGEEGPEDYEVVGDFDTLINLSQYEVYAGYFEG